MRTVLSMALSVLASIALVLGVAIVGAHALIPVGTQLVQVVALIGGAK